MNPSATMIDFVDIPGGSFEMGGIDADKFVTANELPRHFVTLPGFALSRHPITRESWHQVMGGPPFGDGELPVTGIDFTQASEFAARLEARLPSEAEWEHACRAGSQSVFSHASNIATNYANFLYAETGEVIGTGCPSPPGSFPPNAFGLSDMLGNVCEWTADLWHPTYQNAPCDGSPWLADGKPGCRVIRGGAWDHLPRLLRCSWRDWAPEQARWDNLGFRIVRDLTP